MNNNQPVQQPNVRPVMNNNQPVQQPNVRPAFNNNQPAQQPNVRQPFNNNQPAQQPNVRQPFNNNQPAQQQFIRNNYRPSGHSNVQGIQEQRSVNQKPINLSGAVSAPGGPRPSAQQNNAQPASNINRPVNPQNNAPNGYRPLNLQNNSRPAPNSFNSVGQNPPQSSNNAAYPPFARNSGKQADEEPVTELLVEEPKTELLVEEPKTELLVEEPKTELLVENKPEPNTESEAKPEPKSESESEPEPKVEPMPETAGDLLFKPGAEPTEKRSENKIAKKVGLLVCTNGQDAGSNFDLKSGMNLIGVTDNCDIIIKDDSLSEPHNFSIIYDERRENYSLVPGKIASKLFLNNQYVKSAVFMQPRDTIRSGKTEFMLVPYE